MPYLTVAQRRFAYDVEGEGFPLLLTPGDQGTKALWALQMPLLGELCRTIAYEAQDAPGTASSEPVTSAALTAVELAAFLEALALERVYLASPPSDWPLALQIAHQAPHRLEGLVLVAMPHAHDAVQPLPIPDFPTAHLPTLTVPTLLLLSDVTDRQHGVIRVLTTQLPHCIQVVLPTQGDFQRRLGHAMLHFLIHCERQRNLVRGASFLL
jgi:pimeloyl-ACP methyl ester carboxylesterase